jgi:poly-beta-1,6-N-acetyl-D-glucosamine synthase
VALTKVRHCCIVQRSEQVDGHSAGHLNYVLVTPARNEEVLIEETIKAVVRQTVRPTRWVIVSDGSTDATDEIVRKYAAQHEWIELLRMPERKERNFAGKVHAFNAGYSKVKDLHFDIVGSMDADLTFDDDYFHFLIDKFAANPNLGIAGTPFLEDGIGYDFRFSSTDHVSGACQLFRRLCYEAIGGYVPVKGGGIDVIAVLSARMQGWETRTFTEKHCIHHRKMGTAKEGVLKARFKDGQKDHDLGAHPLWELIRSIYQMSRKPILVGGCALFSGYVYNTIRNVQRPVSNDIVRFRRKDQLNRLLRLFRKPSIDI